MGCQSSIGADIVKPENVVSNIRSKAEIIKILGDGASCQVAKSIIKVGDKGKQTVALKQIPKRAQNTKLFQREVQILKLVEHENIIQFIDSYMDKSNYYIATKLCEGGELFDRISKAKKFTEKTAMHLVKQMLGAIQHCHSRNIAHRDLKPENFVFENASMQSKLILIDFGCALSVAPKTDYTEVVGTPYYLAPEYLTMTQRSGAVIFAADIWAIGVICYILVTGQPPFNGKTNKRIFRNIVKSKLKFPKHIDLSQPLKDFIEMMLQKRPRKRPSAEEAMQHPWLQNSGETADHDLGEVIQYLEKFSNESKLRNALADVVANYAPKQDLQRVANVFNSVDSDGDGCVSETEIAKVLIRMGYYVDKAQKAASEMVAKADKDGDGTLSLGEFSKLYASMQLTSDEMLIHKCFSVMDVDSNGTIEFHELQNALHLKRKAAKEIFAEADVNGDGVLTFDEFSSALKDGFQNRRVKRASLVTGFGDMKTIAEKIQPYQEKQDSLSESLLSQSTASSSEREDADDEPQYDTNGLSAMNLSENVRIGNNSFHERWSEILSLNSETSDVITHKSNIQPVDPDEIKLKVAD